MRVLLPRHAERGRVHQLRHGRGRRLRDVQGGGRHRHGGQLRPRPHLPRHLQLPRRGRHHPGDAYAAWCAVLRRLGWRRRAFDRDEVRHQLAVHIRLLRDHKHRHGHAGAGAHHVRRLLHQELRLQDHLGLRVLHPRALAGRGRGGDDHHGGVPDDPVRQGWHLVRQRGGRRHEHVRRDVHIRLHQRRAQLRVHGPQRRGVPRELPRPDPRLQARLRHRHQVHQAARHEDRAQLRHIRSRVPHLHQGRHRLVHGQRRVPRVPVGADHRAVDPGLHGDGAILHHLWVHEHLQRGEVRERGRLRGGRRGQLRRVGVRRARAGDRAADPRGGRRRDGLHEEDEAEAGGGPGAGGAAHAAAARQAARAARGADRRAALGRGAAGRRSPAATAAAGAAHERGEQGHRARARQAAALQPHGRRGGRVRRRRGRRRLLGRAVGGVQALACEVLTRVKHSRHIGPGSCRAELAPRACASSPLSGQPRCGLSR
mmetsp:Transcript_6930/g.24478  ORF Transcript_6930/g.24478 Transcript_6930/m.24478 type:complete len:484 (-) Transcript_6930:1263-2714(-)